MIWWGKEQEKRESRGDKLEKTIGKGKEKQKYVWRRHRIERGKERQGRECIAYNSRALKAAKLEAYNIISKKSANV